MGPDEQTASDIEADAFFAGWAHPTIEQFEAVWAEQHTNVRLFRVTAEIEEFGYWDRKMGARAERRAQRDLAATQVRLAQDERLQALRVAPALAPAVEAPQVVLPAPRIVVLTDAERRETTYWWNRLARREGTWTLGRRIRVEVRNAKEDDRFATRSAAWRAEQRAFERAEWRAVIAHRNARPAIKRANAWVAIDEDRALQIAIAALDRTAPPQARK